ncbi:ceramidase-domain-containing protein [Calycina marina]|uniref:Ceramidase-domain-containing protein n=1 Tax=Calycina marina TaxID=1763456 RepID=A0A9P7Z8P5_9HELO|nr:ceramidase-domain-containing protein [Calycina marina]
MEHIKENWVVSKHYTSFYRASTGGHTPIWGPPTSTLNFCEEDYEFTPYVAELFNTFTNLTYIGLGIKGILNNRKLGEQGLGPKLPYIAIINLGIASSLFHSSLKYPTQMCDEFSMLIATFIVFYRLLSFSQTHFSPNVLLYSLLGLMGCVMVVQFSTGDSSVQQVVFTVMVYFLWSTCFKLIGKLKRGSALKSKMKWMAISGIAFFISGHACWLTDFYACDHLRRWRREVGMPWASLLELHGYWHIFTGIGVYIFMVLVECLRYAPTAGKKDDQKPKVSSAGLWPFTVYLERPSAHKVKRSQ